MLLQNGQPKSLPNIVRQKMAKKPQRVLLKLSGEALMGQKQFGIDNDRLKQYAEEIKQIVVSSTLSVRDSS